MILVSGQEPVFTENDIQYSSVRPNTEYSAEYSAKSADTPITENCVKMAVFDPI